MQVIPFGEVVGGSQSSSFDLFVEIQTGNSLYLLYFVRFEFQKASH